MPVTITSNISEIFADRPLKILTNLSGSSIALNIGGDSSISTLQLEPDQSIYYDYIVNEDLSSPKYNVDIIQTYIEDKILGVSLVDLSEPIPNIVTLPGGTFSLTVNSNKTTKFNNKEYGQQTNHLEILPVLDSQNKIFVIFYRDVEGISYSINNSASSVLISNSNLRYPDEITSMAVQVYESANSLRVYAKLFVGTLREGIKCFTLGKDTTYVDFVDLEKISGELIFKTSPDTYAPLYVVGILNGSVNCPLIVFSRAHKQYYSFSLFNPAATWTIFDTVLPKNIIDISKTAKFVDNTLVIVYTDEVVNNHLILMSTSGVVTTILLPTQEKITGISTFTDPTTNHKYLFLTIDNAVWKYDFELFVWEILLHKDADLVNITTKYLNTYLLNAAQFATITNECKIPLTGLVNFSLAKVNETEYLGYVGSNIGIIQYWFTCLKGNLKLKIDPSFPSRQITKIFNSRVTDLVVPAGTSYVLSCGLRHIVPVEYKIYSNAVVPYLSYVVSKNNFNYTYFERANFTTTTQALPNHKFISKTTKDEGILNQIDQLIDTRSYINDTLRLFLNINGPLYSLPENSYYDKFKLLFEVSDPWLFNYLVNSRSFGKYVYFYINHVANRSFTINDITYSIFGTSTYYVPIYNVTYSLDEYTTDPEPN